MFSLSKLAVAALLLAFASTASGAPVDQNRKLLGEASNVLDRVVGEKISGLQEQFIEAIGVVTDLLTEANEVSGPATEPNFRRKLSGLGKHSDGLKSAELPTLDLPELPTGLFSGFWSSLLSGEVTGLEEVATPATEA